MLLDGKKLVVTGVLTKDSIAAAVARQAQEQGAELVLTSFGRGMRLTERVARTFPTRRRGRARRHRPGQHAALAEELGRRWGKVDGALHAIGFAPRPASGRRTGCWPPGGTRWRPPCVSAYSLKSLTETLVPLMPHGGRSWGSTSTPPRRGRPTTGWAWPRRRWRPPAATWPATWDRAGAGQPGGGSAAHAGRPVDPRLRGAGGPGGGGRRSAGTCATRSPWPRRAWPCCRTGSRPRPARSSTWTAAPTPWRCRRRVEDRLAMLPAADPAEAATLEAGA